MSTELPVVVVTGGSRGIGVEVVARAASCGWAVCFSYLESRDRADWLAAQVNTGGGQALAVQADISREADVVALFKTASHLGSVRGFVANAAIVAPPLRLRDSQPTALGVSSTSTSWAHFFLPRGHSAHVDRRGPRWRPVALVSSAASRIGSAWEIY